MYLCIAFEKSTSVKLKKFGSLAQLNRASDYGSEGYRFESCRSHTDKAVIHEVAAFYLSILNGAALKHTHCLHQ